MPTPSNPLTLGVKVYDLSLNLLDGASVTLVLGSETISATTNSSGEVLLNLGDFSSWSVGDTAVLSANKTGDGEVSQSISLPSSPTFYSLYFAETSDYSFSKHGTYNLVLQGAMLVTYDGRKVTSLNPLPVIESGLPIGKSNPSYSFIRDGNNRITGITMTIGSLSYSTTLTRDGSGYITEISNWSEQE